MDDLFSKQLPYLRAVACNVARTTGLEQDDLFQECCITLLSVMERFNLEDGGGIVRTAARRTISNLMRHNRSQKRSAVFVPLPDVVGNSHIDYWLQQMLAEVRGKLQNPTDLLVWESLTNPTPEILAAYVENGLSFTTMATALGLTRRQLGLSYQRLRGICEAVAC